MYKGDLSREFYPNFTYQIEKKAFWYVYTGLPRRFAPRNDVHTLDCFATLAMSRTLCVLTKFCFAKLAAMLNGLKSFALGYGTPPKASPAGGTCDAEEDGAKRKGGTADGSLLPERPENAPEYC